MKVIAVPIKIALDRPLLDVLVKNIQNQTWYSVKSDSANKIIPMHARVDDPQSFLDWIETYIMDPDSKEKKFESERDYQIEVQIDDEFFKCHPLSANVFDNQVTLGLLKIG